LNGESSIILQHLIEGGHLEMFDKLLADILSQACLLNCIRHQGYISRDIFDLLKYIGITLMGSATRDSGLSEDQRDAQRAPFQILKTLMLGHAKTELNASFKTSHATPSAEAQQGADSRSLWGWTYCF
jgi:hypothetical protein